MVDGGKQAGVTVDDPDTNAWEKPPVSSRGLKGEKAQYAIFCNELRMLGTSTARPNKGVPELSYVLAALQLHDARWTEELLRRVAAAWKGASPQNDIADRIAALCNLAVARAVPGKEATYTGDHEPKWPKRSTDGKPRPGDTLRLGNLWSNMKVANNSFKEFAAAMAARDCGWSEKQVHALVNANRSKAQRKKFPLP